MKYLKARIREAGTWRALALAAVALGVLPEAQASQLAAVVAALVSAALPEPGP